MIRVGTRGSALARGPGQLGRARSSREAELVTITTSGDRGEALGDKSRWTSALERALLAGEIDIAVHSAKDVPGELADGTEIAAIPARAGPARRALRRRRLRVARMRAPASGRAASARAAQLRALRDDIEIVELRGNVDTRLRKLAEGEADAIVLAYAGLIRLGREAEADCVLDDLVPAPGQGALIVQATSRRCSSASSAQSDQRRVCRALRHGRKGTREPPERHMQHAARRERGARIRPVT